MEATEAPRVLVSEFAEKIPGEALPATTSPDFPTWEYRAPNIAKYKCLAAQEVEQDDTLPGSASASRERAEKHPIPAFVALVTVVVSMLVATFLNYATVVARCFALLYLFFTGALLLYLIGMLWFEGRAPAAWLTLFLLIVLELAVLIPLGLSHAAAKVSTRSK